MKKFCILPALLLSFPSAASSSFEDDKSSLEVCINIYQQVKDEAYRGRKGAVGDNLERLRDLYEAVGGDLLGEDLRSQKVAGKYLLSLMKKGKLPANEIVATCEQKYKDVSIYLMENGKYFGE